MRVLSLAGTYKRGNVAPCSKVISVEKQGEDSHEPAEERGRGNETQSATAAGRPFARRSAAVGRAAATGQPAASEAPAQPAIAGCSVEWAAGGSSALPEPT